ncbi:hypothetical protein, partial [Pseudomonas sp. GM67]|uniref:hypothetical protein n=1 Tax=Pseudomonas sp. GM67 TaxID=1144335 RepID=UPI001EE66C56
TKGARALGYLALLQVTRRKGETISSRDRSNGYAPPQKTSAQKKRPTRKADQPSSQPIKQTTTIKRSANKSTPK